ncbi:hypothetical protein C9J21_15290 [Photobacterium phosphoreum]|uniref:Uncharacterized protein n=1 Tax=Photobacterium toruni TaxID=1935446 RepID=A0A1T4UYT3_9GAMM|nr:MULTISPECIES: hypothetical protein [Photobacterium]PSW31689.1 hypothetical protein C9J21_15290 [Photobacterium phosphoreum]SKA57812.1 hypothetical protein CZ814_03902 [Photobacterium toruni]
MQDKIFDYSNDILSSIEVNERCEAYITKYYALGKQLTIERVGPEDVKIQMHTFIDACRAWANSKEPKPKDLYLITPTI